MEPVREQILNLQHISYTYHTLQGETLALSDISFSLKKGEFAAIVGPSGCGKSTLLSLICGLLPCTEGQIKINGKPLKESTTNVGYMLQHDELFEWRTIYNNVILGLEVQHALTARTKQRQMSFLTSMDSVTLRMQGLRSCPAGCGSVLPDPHTRPGAGASSSG